MHNWRDLTTDQQNALFHKAYAKQEPWCNGDNIGFTRDLHRYQCKRCYRAFDMSDYKYHKENLEKAPHLHNDVFDYVNNFNILPPYIDELYKRHFHITIDINPAISSKKHTVTIANSHGCFTGESDKHIAEAMVLALLALHDFEVSIDNKEQQS